MNALHFLLARSSSVPSQNIRANIVDIADESIPIIQGVLVALLDKHNIPIVANIMLYDKHRNYRNRKRRHKHQQRPLPVFPWCSSIACLDGFLRFIAVLAGVFGEGEALDARRWVIRLACPSFEMTAAVAAAVAIVHAITGADGRAVMTAKR